MVSQTAQSSILIIEANAVTRQSLRATLESNGYIVHEAADGNTALQNIEKNPPHLILLDLELPDMDGFELNQRIRKLPQGKDLPILALSGFLETRPGIKFTSALIKPIEPEELLQVVAKYLSPSIPIPDLAKRYVLQVAQMSLLADIADSFTGKKKIENTLQEILTTSLDAAGISKGLSFIKNSENKLILCQIVGYSANEHKQAADFFGHPELLAQVMNTKQELLLSASSTSPEIIHILATQAKITTGLLVPLLAINECFGVLFLGSKTVAITGPHPEIFARTLATQIAETIALSTLFERSAKSELRYRLLMDNATCSIIVQDKTWIIHEVNKQAEVLLGAKKEQLMGKNFKDMMVPKERDELDLQLKNIVQGKKNQLTEGHLQQMSGKIIDIEFALSGIEIDKSLLVINIANDISERNRLKALALLNDRLSMVGKLAAGIAHEINNPIAWMLGNLTFLKKNAVAIENMLNIFYGLAQHPDLKEKFPTIEALIKDPQQREIFKFKEVVEESIEGAEKVQEIVRNLKGFARMPEKEAVATDIHAILDAAINMAYPQIKYRAKLEKNYAPNIPKELMLQSGKLHQVFLNILINAAEAIEVNDPQKNTISISTHLEGKHIKIDIRDTGIGITPENMQYLFQPFYTTKTSDTGTGLGLFICHDIIEKIGGEIKVTSTPQKGSTFTIIIPIAAVTAPSALLDKEPVMTNKNLSQAHLLIVDDEPFILKSLKRTLEPEYQVTMALGGQAALDLIANPANHYDVIICDLIMPEINGVDLYQRLGQQFPKLQQRIIFMTGGVYIADINHFLTSIKNICLEKPFTTEEATEAITKTLLADKK